MPTLSRHCRLSNTQHMRRVLILACVMLSSVAVAKSTATPPMCNSLETTFQARQDTTSTRVQIKRSVVKSERDFRLVGEGVEGNTRIGHEVKLDRSEKEPNAIIKERPKQEDGKSSSAQEMKNMAKRENKKTTKPPTIPSVSYPSFPGGNFAIREFVRKNQQYPQECKAERLRGRVEVLISIAPDGTPHSAVISKSSGNVHMDAEALRIAELMPKWNPAPESEDPQGTECVIFVNFRPGR